MRKLAYYSILIIQNSNYCHNFRDDFVKNALPNSGKIISYDAMTGKNMMNFQIMLNVYEPMNKYQFSLLNTLFLLINLFLLYSRNGFVKTVQRCPICPT